MNPAPAPHEPATGARLGRWEVVSARGRGGMATVYVARGPDGALGALKLMHPGGSADEVERRFQREFRTLSRLDHPNITRVYDWGSWEGRPYFVMELVDGEDLRTLADRWAVAPPENRFEIIHSALVQVARALAYVHGRGLVHRDVTPSNIMLLADGTVKLMDFGVVKETGSSELTAQGELLGTVAYVAPEQINGDRIDARTDLYSLGAVLYLLLTGRRPFNARTLAGYLDKHLHRPPRPPRDLVPAVPKALEDVCLRLLQKEPGDRFASAEHLLYALEGPLPAATPGWPPALAGRGDAVAAISQAISACQEGQGGVLLLEGGSGAGKSRLVHLAMELASRAGMPGNRIRARPSADPLVAYAGVYQALRAEGIAPRGVLERAFGEGGAGVQRYSLFSAFREMVGGTRPRVFAVDDLHFADPGSVELLEYLVRNTLALGREPILWLLTRAPGVNDEATDGLAVGTRTDVTPLRVQLDPLSASAVEEWVASIVGDSPASQALARRLHTESEGSPGYLSEVLRGLIDDGTIVPDGPVRRLTLDASAVAGATLPLPRSVRASMLARLASLPDASRRVADLLAVARQEVPYSVLADVTGLSDSELTAALEPMIDAGLVRERRTDAEDHLDFTQPRMRDLLYAGLPADERARLHRAIGAAIERGFRRKLSLVVEALAHHFELGGVPGKACAYQVRAGQRLIDRSFVAEGERFFARALALEPLARDAIPLEDADRQLADLLLRRADALSHLGRWADVPACLSQAERLAGELGDERLSSRAAAALGALARHQQDYDEAERQLSSAIRLAERVGEPTLKIGPLNGLGAIVWSKGDLEGARRWWAEELTVGEATRDERSLGYGYNGLGLVALCRGQAVEARRYFEQSTELFERIGLLGPLAVARTNLVEIHHFTGNLRRGLELAEKTLATARETHHPLGVAVGLSHISLVNVDLGRFDQAMEAARESLRVVRQQDHKEYEVATLITALRAAWALQDYEALRRGLDEAEGMLRYDPEGFAPIVYAWRARLAAQDGDSARAERELERSLAAGSGRWPYQECRLDLVLARVYAAMGNSAEACRRAEAAVRRADACGFRLYALKGHALAAQHSSDEAAVARHRRVADALARSLAANLSREDAERFLDIERAPAVA